MIQRIRLTEAELHNMVKVAVIRILKETDEKYEYYKHYVVFDGTTYYPVYGMDVEGEIKNNGAEIVDGSFDNIDDAWNKSDEFYYKKPNYNNYRYMPYNNKRKRC